MLLAPLGLDSDYSTKLPARLDINYALAPPASPSGARGHFALPVKAGLKRARSKEQVWGQPVKAKRLKPVDTLRARDGRDSTTPGPAAQARILAGGLILVSLDGPRTPE